MPNAIVVLTTTPNEEEGNRLGERIVRERLAACVQVVPKMTSYFFWEGEVQKEFEHLLLIKTLEDKFDRLSEFIRSNHSYEVPEIVALSAESVSESYLGWMSDYLND